MTLQIEGATLASIPRPLGRYPPTRIANYPLSDLALFHHCTMEVTMRYNRTLVILGAVVLLLISAAAQSKPLLSPGDRMVFLGDSITEQRIYTRYVMAYFTMAYPGAKLSFRNAGWGGDTSPGGLRRLQRDVLSLKPKVVSICFGMNDAGYQRFDKGRFDVYMEGMKGLVTEIKRAGAQVVLLTPGCVDGDKNPGIKEFYNDTLADFAKGVKQLARAEQIPVFDINALMLDIQTRAKADDPKFTMIPDSVHPSNPGHAIMAFGLLKALGCEGAPPSLEIDAAAAKASAKGCKVDDIKVSAGAVAFTRTDEALPMVFNPDASVVFKYLPPLEEMCRYQFTVTGLADGNWKLTVDGAEVGTFAAADLASGVDLAGKPGPWQKIGEKVLQDCSEQENTYFLRWRQVSLASVPPKGESAMKAALSGLDKVVDAWESSRIADTKARTWKWSLELAK